MNHPFDFQNPAPALDLTRIRPELAERAGLDQARVALREGRSWTPEDDRRAGERFRDAMVGVALTGRAFRDPTAAANARAILAGRMDVVATPGGPDLRERGTGRGLLEAVEAALAGDLAILTLGAAGSRPQAPQAPPHRSPGWRDVADACYPW